MTTITETSKTIINNINPTKNPITTITGIVFGLLSLITFYLPSMVELKEPLPEYLALSLGVIGVILYVAPDSITTIVTTVTTSVINVIKRKSETI